MANFAVLSLLLLQVVYSLPTTITVNHNSKECLYDMLEKGEKVTISLFILSGAELKGGLLLEGPVALSNATSGADVLDMVDIHEKGRLKWGPYIKIEEDVNFEQVIPDFSSEDTVRDDDDDNLWKQMDDDKLSTEEIARRLEERKKHAQLARQRAMEARRSRVERIRQKGIRVDGEPVQRTLTAESTGWYRACVKGNWYQITAELEMRKESDLGGIDPDTGHVISYATKEEDEENKYLDEDTASKEEGIKAEDFSTVKGQLQNLRRLLSQIQQKQTSERHRLVVHAASNEHSHSRMVLSNLFETVMFMAVTGFQVYTIRKWFSGENSLLVR
jgi:hypothetical protein